MKIRLALPIALLAVCVAATGAAGADAHTKRFPTTVEVIDEDVLEDGVTGIVAARVRAGRVACRANRVVVGIGFYTDGSRRVIDRTRTTALGALALTFDLTGFDRGVLSVPRKRFGPRKKKHRHVCRPATSGGEMMAAR